jgi:hypothetical protein
MEDNQSTQPPPNPSLKENIPVRIRLTCTEDWLEKSVNELGYLDYFEFAYLCDKSESTSNAYFTMIIEKLSKSNNKYIFNNARF